MIEKVLITQKWISYLEKRNLSNQYRKAKVNLLNWRFTNINFSIREPKRNKIYYFRVNKQFRIFWYIENKVFKVIKIDNHQNK